MGFSRFVLGLSFLGLAADAAATDFIGIEMGRPLDMTRCVDFSYSDPAVYRQLGYGKQPAYPCWVPQADKSDREVRTDGMYVVIVKADVPDGISMLMPILFDGIVEVVVAETRGLAVQDGIEAALARKFGEPVRRVVAHPSNAFGATFPSTQAEWQLPDARVEFNGVNGNVKSGRITIMTARGQARMQAQAEMEQAGKIGF